MVRIGMVLVMGGILVSMSIAMFAWTQYQPVILEASPGEPVIVGPVEYSITFDGTNAGVEGFQPQDVFAKIRISMQNVADEEVTLNGGQFHFAGPDMNRVQAVFGNGTLGEEDMLIEKLQPGSRIIRTTQFDVPFDEDSTYHVYVRPAKEHGTTDYAIICVTNC